MTENRQYRFRAHPTVTRTEMRPVEITEEVELKVYVADGVVTDQVQIGDETCQSPRLEGKELPRYIAFSIPSTGWVAVDNANGAVFFAHGGSLHDEFLTRVLAGTNPDVKGRCQ